VVGEAVSHVDLLPTILEITGQPFPKTTQGISLLPLMTDSADGVERFVYSESLYPMLHYGWAPLTSLRGNSFKLIDAPQAELYALDRDPLEGENLLTVERQIARSMQDELTAMLEQIEADDGASARQPELDEQALAQLEALGYLAGRGTVGLEREAGAERADPKDRIRLHQLVMSAQSDMGRNEDAAAEEKLHQVLETDPNVIEAHQMLGTIANRQKQFDIAMRHFQIALELEPDHPASLFGLATAYRETDRVEDALNGYRRLLEHSPTDTRAAVDLVDLLVASDEIAEAITILETAVSERQDLPGLQNQLGELYATEDRREAAKSSFMRAIELSEAFAQPRFNLAVLLEAEGRIEEAIALYEEALVLAPKHYQAQFNLGRLHGDRGEINRQQQLWEAAVASNPDFIRGHYYVAKLIMDRGGDLAGAEEITRQALAKDPEHRAGPLGYFLLADILNRQGRPKEAHQAVAEARKIESEGS
jgi:tetratricopeptide (TPR) repeat protein